MGSVILLTDSRGNTKETYSYDAFGNQYGDNSFGHSYGNGWTTGAVNEYGYNGKRFDSAVGLADYGFRDYAPQVGRFTTVDPIKSGSNWYAYVGNDPVNFIDPLGLTPSDSNIEVPNGLLNQNDPAISGIPNMPESGCNFRSCQNIAEIETGTSLLANQIVDSVATLLESGAITETMRVNNPDAVINDAFDRLGEPETTATVGWGGNGEEPDYTIMWGETPNNSNEEGADHARAGDSDSDLLNDPYTPDIQNMEHLYSYDVFIHKPED